MHRELESIRQQRLHHELNRAWTAPRRRRRRIPLRFRDDVEPIALDPGRTALHEQLRSTRVDELQNRPEGHAGNAELAVLPEGTDFIYL